MTSRPRGGPPGRRVSRSAVKRELLVFTEGERTEVQYLVHWHRRYREHVSVNVDDWHGAPLQLVEHAIEAKRRDERQYRRGGGRAYDEIWCVYDIDHHANLARAQNLARSHGIHLAISNPCIELWFVLHFEAQNAFIEGKDARSRARRLLQCRRKTLSPRTLIALEECHDDAVT